MHMRVKVCQNWNTNAISACLKQKAKPTWESILNVFMKERSLIIALFVMLDLLWGVTLKLMWQLYMKEKSRRNVTSVINLFQSIDYCTLTLYQLIKELDLHFFQMDAGAPESVLNERPNDTAARRSGSRFKL